ncbi:unnamed protein product [Urochloa humidicola]
MLPLNLLWLRSSTANDNELMQNDDGINPWKLLFLELSTTRLLVVSHTVDGNSPDPSEMVETDIEHDDATGGQQLRRKAASEGVVRQEALQVGEVTKGWRDAPSKASGSQGDPNNRAISAAGYSIPLAAIGVIPP